MQKSKRRGSPLQLEVGARIRRVRQERGLSQEGLMKICESVSLNTIQRAETGKSWPSSDNFEDIANALDVSVRYLVTGQAEVRPDDPIGVRGETMIYRDSPSDLHLRNVTESANRSYETVSSFAQVG